MKKRFKKIVMIDVGAGIIFTVVYALVMIHNFHISRCDILTKEFLLINLIVFAVFFIILLTGSLTSLLFKHLYKKYWTGDTNEKAQR
jgi:hypothetical protein